MTARAVGANDKSKAAKYIGNSAALFAFVSAGATVILLFFVNPVLKAVSIPEEACEEAASYLMICFAGIPFITAYNVISAVFRGLGDSKD